MASGDVRASDDLTLSARAATEGAKEVTTLKPRSKRKAPESSGEGGAEAKVAKADPKQDALSARMGGSSAAGSFTFGGGAGSSGTTTIGF